MSDLKQLEAKVQALKAEIRIQQVALEDRNRQLTALHHVWCSGPCGAPLTKEVVEEAIRNTDRMITKFNGQRSNRAWKQLHDYPDDQHALIYTWKLLRDAEAERDRLVAQLGRIATLCHNWAETVGADWEGAPTLQRCVDELAAHLRRTPE